MLTQDEVARIAAKCSGRADFFGDLEFARRIEAAALRKAASVGVGTFQQGRTVREIYESRLRRLASQAAKAARK